MSRARGRVLYCNMPRCRRGRSGLCLRPEARIRSRFAACTFRSPALVSSRIGRHEGGPMLSCQRDQKRAVARHRCAHARRRTNYVYLGGSLVARAETGQGRRVRSSFVACSHRSPALRGASHSAVQTAFLPADSLLAMSCAHCPIAIQWMVR